MTSQFNNNPENNEHIFQEENHQFRPVFFDTSKRVMSNSATGSSQESPHIKRARLDSTAGATASSVSTDSVESLDVSDDSSNSDIGVASPSSNNDNTVTMMDVDVNTLPSTVSHESMTIDAVISAVDCSNSTSPYEQTFKHQNHPSFVSTPGCATPSIPEDVEKISTNTKVSHHHTHNLKINKAKVRKYRSKSLPNIIFASQTSEQFYKKLSKDVSLKNNNNNNNNINNNSNNSKLQASELSVPLPLPPVNIQSLREIDLSEILKNPQLRHDIIFDPQLQFRPNLDGERGRRKKITYEKYWNGVKDEIKEIYLSSKPFNKRASRLPILFTTLREILLSLLPSKDQQSVCDTLDIELINQQLSKKSLDFVSLAAWLSAIFKSHCAPMRDPWVDEMTTKFAEAEASKSVSRLVEGLRMIFTILEAMKLDVANHQIRILRPVLIETAVEFERDYFLQMVSRCKLDISDSINWFQNQHGELLKKDSSITASQATVSAVLSLLSCSQMVSEFPSSLAFDHSRLIALRANVRQLVCLQICLVLYRQLVAQNNTDVEVKSELLSKNSLNKNLKREIMAIVTDDDGNVKWTRNIGAIALQLVRRSNPDDSQIPKDSQVDFAFNWLIKQTQPSSQVYSLMETKMFNVIRDKIEESDDFSKASSSSSSSTLNCTPVRDLTSLIPVAGSENAINSRNTESRSKDNTEDEDDISGVSSRIALLCKFHWNVFGTYYA